MLLALAYNPDAARFRDATFVAAVCSQTLLTKLWHRARDEHRHGTTILLMHAPGSVRHALTFIRTPMQAQTGDERRRVDAQVANLPGVTDETAGARAPLRGQTVGQLREAREWLDAPAPRGRVLKPVLARCRAFVRAVTKASAAAAADPADVRAGPVAPLLLSAPDTNVVNAPPGVRTVVWRRGATDRPTNLNRSTTPRPAAPVRSGQRRRG